MIDLEAFHTHLYPGARGRIVSGDLGDGPVSVTFSDLSRASGALESDRLALDSYRTTAGTDVSARRWIIAVDGDGFRITARAD